VPATLLALRDLHKSYVGVPVLDGVDFTMAEGQKIGLIGRNGAGKSTLLRIVMDLESPDDGEVVRFPQLRLGYLEQLSAAVPGESVSDFLVRQSGQPEWECAKVAGSFDIKGIKLSGPLEALSNGWQMRAKLSALLLQEPNLLLLDEPTNYLDLPTLLLLEANLREWRGAYVVVSHDRAFLRATCSQTAEVERGKLTFFNGPLDVYLEHKERQLEEARRFNKNVAAQRKHLQSFVDRFRYKANLASQAQSKLKMIARLENAEIPMPLDVASIRIPNVEGKDGTALWVTSLSAGHDERAVLEGVDFEIRRGEHVAVVGENGAGKTTLMETLTGALPPVAGRVKWHPHLSIGTYAPHRLTKLDPSHTVRGYLWSCALPGTTDEDVLRAAGDMLFEDEALDKRLGVLSGGERSRLALAGLFLGGHDALVLDEPTNHLDVETAEALAAALGNWSGTLLFVSHDRTFVGMLASAILEVKAGKVRRFPGSYEEYVWQLRQEGGRGRQAVPVAPDAASASPAADPGDRPRPRLAELKEAARMSRVAEKALASLRKEREEILEEFLANPTVYLSDRYERLQQIEKMIATEEERWLLWEGKKDDISRGA
jgi:ATP-binding cassette subfamily F protein 3